MNRNITIAILILILITVLGGSYVVFFKNRQAGTISTDQGPAFFLPSSNTASNPASTTAPNTDLNTNPNANLPATDNLPISNIQGFNRLFSQPVAGASASTIGASSTVIFVDKATGDLYQIETGKNPVRITDTGIPHIETAWISRNKNNPYAILQYTNSSNQTNWLAGTVKASTSTGELIGKLLTDPITEITGPTGSKRVFYLATTGNITQGKLFNIETGKATVVFSSPFRDWQASWTANTSILINTKPAAGVDGFAFLLNPDTMKLTKIIGPTPGLTASLAPNAQKALSSKSYQNGKITLNLNNVADLTVKELPLVTLPEKCAWSKNSIEVFCGVPNLLATTASYPDDWYSGEVSFNDAIWKINTDTGSTTLLFSPETEDLGQPIDVYQPFLSADEKYLLMINKYDLTLWSLNLSQEF